MDSLKNILTTSTTGLTSTHSNEKDKFEIMKAIFLGVATDEDKECYKKHFITKEEKQIGKPIFDMNEEERIQFNVLSYNNSSGELEGYDCKVCKNKGDVMYYDQELRCEIYKPCRCRNIRKTIKKMEQSGLGNLLSIYKFEKYETTEPWQQDVYNRARRFVEDEDKNWFVMLGQSGCGKSHICTAISRELLKQGMDLKYMMWLDDSVKLKQHKMNAEVYAQMIEEIKNTQVLYIDDFFKSDNDAKPSPADINLANEILNYRYNKARMDKSKRWVTIISSERTLRQLLEYDVALGGRIVEMARPDYLIMIEGSDKNYRTKNML